MLVNKYYHDDYIITMVESISIVAKKYFTSCLECHLAQNLLIFKTSWPLFQNLVWTILHMFRRPLICMLLNLGWLIPLHPMTYHCFCLIFQTANLVFFVLTSRKLYETWRLTKANLDTNEFRVSPRAQRNSNNFKVIFKIFVIMGVTWFSELFGFILSWICGRDKVWKYFVLNDIINLLQAGYCYC